MKVPRTPRREIDRSAFLIRRGDQNRRSPLLLRKYLPGSRFGRLKDDSVTEPLETLDESTGNSALVNAVEVVRAEFLINGLALQEMVGDHQQSMGDSEDGPFGAAARRDTRVQGCQIVVALPRHGPAGLAQAAPQSVAPFAGPPTEALACTLEI